MRLEKIDLKDAKRVASEIKLATRQIDEAFEKLSKVKLEFNSRPRKINEFSGYAEASSIIDKEVTELLGVVNLHLKNSINVLRGLPQMLEGLAERQGLLTEESIKRIDNPYFDDVTIGGLIYSQNNCKLIAKMNDLEKIKETETQELLYKTSKENFFIITIDSSETVKALPVCLEDAVVFYDTASVKLVDSRQVFQVFA